MQRWNHSMVSRSAQKNWQCKNSHLFLHSLKAEVIKSARDGELSFVVRFSSTEVSSYRRYCKIRGISIWQIAGMLYEKLCKHIEPIAPTPLTFYCFL